MSEQEKKLTLEEEFKARLNGDLQKNTLDFMAYLMENELLPNPVHTNCFDYLGEGVCTLNVFEPTASEGPLDIYFNGSGVCEPANFQVDNYLKEIAWANVNKCGQCHEGWKDCGGGDKMIFGKKYNTCHSPLCFANPDAKTFENIKKLVNIWKQNIVDRQLTK